MPSDADFLITHMSNSRYLREFDFGRLDLAGRTGLLAEVIKRGGSFPVSATSIRYRLPVMMFATYKVNSDTLNKSTSTKFLYLAVCLLICVFLFWYPRL